jgi:hypothetical protein
MFVGGSLLALLFVADAYAPAQPVAARADTIVAENPTLRIRSDHKWPQAIVFDTTQPTIVPPPVLKADAGVTAPANVAEISPRARVRETFAQFVPVEAKSEPKLQPRKRKIAKYTAGSRMAQVAQPARFGVFGNNIW